MAPALKVKRLKKTSKKSSTAVLNDKPKWEKPRKSISAQSEVTKIKNVNKRSFDPIKANRGVVLLKNIPHGFYEEEMRKYFGQFGLVTRVRLARSQRTGRSKGFAYIEFRVKEVAEIAAQTMNNYIMFKHKLTSVFIPPEKQTHNFFRKDVTFTTDTNGETNFSSAKIESIEKAIGDINRQWTDEEHAKRIKRDQKNLQKQQKKYGVDLSNILASGNSTSSEATPPKAEVKAKESKKKATLTKKSAAVVAEKKPETKRTDTKVATKKDNKKKATTQVSSNGSESLLQGLLDKTYDTDTDDEDFKIDHSFNADEEDSDGLAGLIVTRLAPDSDDDDGEFDSDDGDSDDGDDFEINDESEDDGKLEVDADSDDDDAESDDDEQSIDDEEESDDNEGWEDDAESVDDAGSDDDAESNDDGVSDDDDESLMEFDEESDLDDDESEDEPPQFLRLTSKDVKKSLKGVVSNGAGNVKAKTNLKRKLKDDSSSSQSEVSSKKPKQIPNKKAGVPSAIKASIPVPEPSKVVLNKKKLKQNRLEKVPSTSSSEPESLPTKNQKTKPAPQITTKLAPDTKKSKINKKAKQILSKEITLSSPIADTTSSEPENSKQKVQKNKKSKLGAGSVPKPANVIVQAKNEKPAGIQLQTKKDKKTNQPAKNGQSNFNLKTVPATLEVPKQNKKNQPAKNEQTKFNPKTASPKQAAPEIQKSKNQPKASAKPAAQKPKEKNQQQANGSPKKITVPKQKNKQTTVVNGEATVPKPEPVKIDKKQKKAKPVTSSLISENGMAKKPVKAPTTKANPIKSTEKPKKSSLWLTASETDGDDVKKPKEKGVKANLKSIVHKNNSKKKNDNVKSLDAKKIKQTPDELLRVIASKDLKQKSKKKSK